MHFEFLECGIKRLQKSPKIIVVGEVGLGKLEERKAHQKINESHIRVKLNP